MTITFNGSTGEVPASWTTAGRPASPAAGQTGYNTTLNALETYNGTSWVSCLSTLSSSTTNTVTNKIAVSIGGTTYYLLASTSGT
jgi:hypothetical protein